jgi:hypothetical protein
MKAMQLHCVGISVWMLAIPLAFAQTAPTDPGMKMVGSDGAVVIGQPYIAVENVTVSKPLADGTMLSHRTQEQKWRDADGRFRKQTGVVMADGQVEFRRAEIFDPVNHTLTTLEMGQKRAVVLHLPQGQEAEKLAALVDCGCRVRVHPGVQVRTEALPNKTVAGVYGVGKRTTKVRPPGTIGNDREVVSTSDRWDSPELHILLYSSLDDPREKMVREVTTLERRQPDTAVFQVPADFTVKDLPLHKDGSQ